MTAQELYQMLDTPLRWGNSAGWAMIVLFALRNLPLLIRNASETGPRLWVLAGLIGVGLCLFQYRALAGIVHPKPDGYSTSALSSLLISAVLILLIKVTRAPPGHQRAVLLTHAAFLVICATVGVLSGVQS